MTKQQFRERRLKDAFLKHHGVTQCPPREAYILDDIPMIRARTGTARRQGFRRVVPMGRPVHSSAILICSSVVR